MKYFYLRNLDSTKVVQGSIDVAPTRRHPEFADKAAYRRWCEAKTTDHQFISLIEGLNPHLRTTSGTNPPAFIHGLVAEFDAVVPTDWTERLRAAPIPPAWACRSFSGHARAFWPLAEPVGYSEAITSEFYKAAWRELKAHKLLPGFEEAESSNTTKYFELGHDWVQLGGGPIPGPVVERWLFAAGEKIKWANVDSVVPLALVREECSKRWPAAWPGGWERFELGARGVRFWDNGDAASVIVRESGMQCFTGPKPFVTWAELLGGEFVRNARLDSISSAVNGIYFLNGKDRYLVESPEGWVNLRSGDVENWLVSRGLNPKTPKGEIQSPIDAALFHIQNLQKCDYAGPIGGHDSGVYSMCGRRVVATESPRMVRSAPGEWPIIRGLIDVMFGIESAQAHVLLAWIQLSYRMFRTHQRRPGQALAIAGPVGCGKSRLQENILAPLFGGRVAKAGRYFSGSTQFNADLVGADLLAIEDDFGSSDPRVRRHIGAAIKQAVANDVQPIHGKHKDQVNLTPLWRVYLSLNDEPENVSVLPILDGSVDDKLILLKASKGPMPMPTSTDEEMALFRAALAADLPGFAHYLETEFKIDPYFADPRYGVASYHHPEILDILRGLDEAEKLMGLIDHVIFGGQAREEQLLTAEAIEDQIQTFSPAPARKLFWASNTCGTLLGTLAKRYPDRVIRARTNQSRIWRLLPEGAQ